MPVAALARMLNVCLEEASAEPVVIDAGRVRDGSVDRGCLADRRRFVLLSGSLLSHGASFLSAGILPRGCRPCREESAPYIQAAERAIPSPRTGLTFPKRHEVDKVR